MKQKSMFSLTDTAILAAFCMFLSLIEYMIPKPLPFLRLGLAHLPILLSLMIFTPQQTLLLTLLKITGQGLVNGSLFSYIFLFSASGSITSTLIMLAVYHMLGSKVSLVGISIAGAAASNLVQVMLAKFFIFGEAAILIAPVFLSIGLVSSILLGLFATGFTSQSEWIQSRLKTGEANITNVMVQKAKGMQRFAFICGLISVPAFVFQQNTILSAALALLFIILSIVQGKRFRLLPNLIMAAGITAANLITAHGRVLLEIGNFHITAGALESGAAKSALIIGLIYISRVSVRKGLQLPGRLGSMLSLVFYYFEKFTEGRRIEPKNIVRQLDDRLIELTNEGPSKNAGPETAERSPGALDYITAVLPPAAAWTALLL